MERRDFIQKSIIGLGTIGLVGVNNNLFAFTPPPLSSAYEYDMNSGQFANKLEHMDLAYAAHEAAADSTGRRAWIKGEAAQPDFERLKIERAHRDSLNNRPNGFTPTILLNGKETQVFGQYFVTNIGKVGLIRGFDGQYYKVRPEFNRVFSHRYECYGLPSSHYESETCHKCKDTYVKQHFNTPCSSGGYTRITLYTWANCAKGGYHDDIFVEEVGPCKQFGDKYPLFIKK